MYNSIHILNSTLEPLPGLLGTIPKFYFPWFYSDLILNFNYVLHKKLIVS